MEISSYKRLYRENRQELVRHCSILRDLGRNKLRSDESPYGDVMSPYGRYEWLTPRDESPDGDDNTYGGVAQLGEHLPCKQGVKGSIPFISTKRGRSRAMIYRLMAT